MSATHEFDDVLPRCDVINMLRIQFERQRSGLFPSIHEYARMFRMIPEPPQQWLIFFHPKYGATSQWKILLQDAKP